MTVFVNLFQNLGSGYMKLLPESQIESISAIENKKREDKISLYLRVDLSPAHRACFPPPRLIIVFSILRQIFEEKNCSAPSCLKNSRAVPGISFLICWLINYNGFFLFMAESWFLTVVWLECHYEVTHCRLV
jgi:hypothetical protein